MHKTIDLGHTFEIQNRCESGECVEASHQTLQFLKIADDHVESIGVFTQDVIAVLIERAKWQHENTPYSNTDVEEYRRNAITGLEIALRNWDKFTQLRIIDGAKLLGHIKQ